MSYEYFNTRRIIYNIENEGHLCFIPVCPKCGRYVKSDESVLVNLLGELKKESNATCKKCGRIEMPCEGYL
jgi:hypothetical protein